MGTNVRAARIAFAGMMLCRERRVQTDKCMAAIVSFKVSKRKDFFNRPAGTLCMKIRDGLRHGSREHMMWESYASRVAGAWNLQLLLCALVDMEPGVPALILADRLADKGLYPEAERSIREDYGVSRFPILQRILPPLPELPEDALSRYGPEAFDYR